MSAGEGACVAEMGYDVGWDDCVGGEGMEDTQNQGWDNTGGQDGFIRFQQESCQ